MPKSLFASRQTPATFHIAILVFPDLSLMSLAATMEPLRAANRISGQTLYEWSLVSIDGQPVRTTSAVVIDVKGPFEKDIVCDALIMIASMDDRRNDRALHAKLRHLARRRIPIGAVEAASWTLAKAGLLSGRRATTHWEDLEAFADAFPDVTVVPDRYVIDGTCLTTGGATPALDMMLALITAHHGMNVALNAASLFIYDQQRSAEDPQATVSVGRLAATHPKVAQVIRMMEKNIASPQSIPHLAREAGFSIRALELQFRSALAMSPNAYYLELRLNAARRLLVQSASDMTTIADACGFTSASTLARGFRRRFACSPTQFRRDAGLTAAQTPVAKSS